MTKPPLGTRIRWWRLQHPWLGRAGSLLVLLVAMLVAADVAGPSAATDPVLTVARRDLSVGHTIDADDLERRRGPAPASPSLGDPVGRVVTSPILAGERIPAERVAPSGLTGTAALVPPGHRAVALPVALAAPPLAVGDRVDVLAGAAEQGFVARVVARRAVVVAADEEAITIALDERASTDVADALATGLVTLALHGAEP